MNGASFVHDWLELRGWKVEIADAQHRREDDDRVGERPRCVFAWVDRRACAAWIDWVKFADVPL
jgi:hypothetical protein